MISAARQLGISPPARGGVPARRAGWWELDCAAHGRRAAPVPVTFSLLAQRESHQRERAPRSPPLPRELVAVTPCAARWARRSAELAHRPHSCKHLRRELASLNQPLGRLTQSSPETPGHLRCSGGSQGIPTPESRKFGCISVIPERSDWLSLLRAANSELFEGSLEIVPCPRFIGSHERRGLEQTRPFQEFLEYFSPLPAEKRAGNP